MSTHDYFNIDKVTEKYTSVCLDMSTYFSGRKCESWLRVEVEKKGEEGI